MTVLIPLEVRPFGFVPGSQWGEEQQQKYPVGSRVWATISASRSTKMNSFYWAFVSLVAKGIGWDKETLSDEFLIRTGRLATIKMWADGTVKTAPLRISKMDHEEFTNYVDAAIDLALSEYVNWTGKAAFLGEIAKMARVTFEEAKTNRD